MVSRRAVMRDVLADSLANFHLGQRELEWTTVAYALYLPPIRVWTNRFGETFSFDDIAHELMRRPLALTSCCGTHVLHTLAILTRADAQISILSPDTRENVHRHLRQAVQVLVAKQQTDGRWTPDWFNTFSPYVGAAVAERSLAPTDSNCLLVTSHVAELLLYLPSDIPVPDEVLRAAASWLAKNVEHASIEDGRKASCPFTHALCVLRHATA
jgi:hypothetical protein